MPELQNAIVAIASVDIEIDAKVIEIKDYDELMQSLPAAVAPDPVFVAQSEDDRKKIQKALCLTDEQADGIWGPITKAALVTFQDSEGETPDGVLTEVPKDKLLRQTDEQIAARCMPG